MMMVIKEAHKRGSMGIILLIYLLFSHKIMLAGLLELPFKGNSKKTPKICFPAEINKISCLTFFVSPRDL